MFPPPKQKYSNHLSPGTTWDSHGQTFGSESKNTYLAVFYYIGFIALKGLSVLFR
jgi:hypothetical protein